MTSPPSDCGFQILLEDGPCLVVAKPGGLLTQAPPHIDSLELRIKAFIKRRDHKPGRVYLGMPHRLDRPVSGALVVARHVRAAKRISQQFESRQVTKTYWAAVEGEWEEDAGTWTDFVRKIPDVARGEVVPESHPEARRAVLHYRVRRRGGGVTLLEIELETGRMHQIRLQCAHRKIPVVGDALYGARQSFGPDSDEPRGRWIALHARRLAFRHPMHRGQVDITAPWPEFWGPLLSET